MEDIIYMLPDAVANQIAAGEVVQRPASVVKELLENAVDAGATEISLIIKDGGKALIQVVDNGKGMSFNDAMMCFERHATSKLRTADDLFALRTMGFRGEAMASIAAVAQVEMRTRQHEAEVGTLVQIDGNVMLKREPVACPVGTNTAVKNLFFNVPARRNFLKSTQVETRYILEELTRVALANPQIGFSYYVNEALNMKLGGGKLSQRIVELFGNQYREQLLPCQESLNDISIEGYLGKPEHARRTRGDQYFFVNERFIKSSLLHHAIMTAFADLLPPDTYPFYVLKIRLDPKEIDVNVHPTKTEIKFQDERMVYSLVQIAAKQSLSSFQIAPSINFDEDVNHSFASIRLGGHASTQLEGDAPKTTWPSHFTNQQAATDAFFKFQAPAYTPPVQKTLPGFTTQPSADGSRTITLGSGLSKLGQLQAHPLPLQQTAVNQDPQLVLGKYIIKVYDHGLMLVSVKAAYERIVYERLLKQKETPHGGAQANIFQQTLSLSPADFQLAMDLQPDLAALGLVIEPFGQHTVVIRSLPADFNLGSQTEASLLEELLEQMKQPDSGQNSGYQERMVRSLAKQQAARMAKPYSAAEQEELINRLLATSLPHYAPDGRPTMIILDADKLESVLRLPTLLG